MGEAHISTCTHVLMTDFVIQYDNYEIDVTRISIRRCFTDTASRKKNNQ